MNESYFQLPLDKKQNLINAGYKLFAIYPYKKASMSAIAEEGNISKSLLFYYFKNKKEYYMFLFDTAIEFLNGEKVENINGQSRDLFELVSITVKHRMNLIHEYPYLYKFITRAYYETFEEIRLELDKKKKVMLKVGKEDLLNIIDYDKFKNPDDVKVLINIILCIAEGFMRGLEDMDMGKIMANTIEFEAMMESLKQYYYK
ncbi:TetR/AcrR family transcriptional regulator [Clostridium sp.]|uniref:TetR/AcrR family transcriptional regulator n=1 Tax=Clostridium sp. TaxID=1506 RepID=UPI002FC72EB8